jgi:hypothetical protein
VTTKPGTETSPFKGKERFLQAVVLLIDMLAFSIQVIGWFFLVGVSFICLWLKLSRPSDPVLTLFLIFSITFGCFLLFLAGGLYKKRRIHLLLVAGVNAFNLLLFGFGLASRNSSLPIFPTLTNFLLSAFVLTIAIVGLAKHTDIRDRQ